MEDVLARYLDGDLDEAAASELLRAAAADPRLARDLREYEALLEAADRLPVHRAPAGLADRVMGAVVAPGRTARAGRRTYWLPAAAALVVGLLLGHLALPQRPVVVPGSPPDAGVVVVDRSRRDAPGVQYRTAVRLVYEGSRPDLASVAVAGSFNGWDPRATPMIRDERGWSLLLILPPGEHEYMFVEDGERWVTDPRTPIRREDGFGGANGVLQVRA